MGKKNIEKGKYYFFKVRISGRELDYEGLITYFDDKGFRVKTEEDCGLRFKFKDLIYFEEIEGKCLDESKVFVVRRKGPLKEVEGPKGL